MLRCLHMGLRIMSVYHTVHVRYNRHIEVGRFCLGRLVVTGDASREKLKRDVHTYMKVERATANRLSVDTLVEHLHPTKTSTLYIQAS